jgi:nucleotide-binding universal stress UspA family protein
MFARILAATDFSSAADAAVAQARHLAARTGATLHVLHVVENPFLKVVLTDPRAYETAALRQLQDRIPASDGVKPVFAVERSDEPADEITSYARIHDIDLIVMGTHGRRAMAHLLVGSVAEKVARTAPCPVLTMRDAPAGSQADGPRILVPTDFSATADAALLLAVRLAPVIGASIHLLHVVEHSAVAGSLGSGLYVPDRAAVREEQVAEAKTQLARRTSNEAGSPVTMTSDVATGPTAATITAAAADGGFTLIVMGTRGRGGLAHLLIGSIAESVIRTAQCPVLTVKAPAEAREHSRGAEKGHVVI